MLSGVDTKRLVVAAFGIALLATACTSNPKPAPDLTGSSACTDASGLTVATNGAISAGPFDVSRDSWTDPGGAKLWVRTSVDQQPTTAVIKAEALETSPGKRTATLTQTRGPDQIAEASGDPGGLFYPGSLPLLATGQWRLTVTIGGDDGCFLFAAG